MRALGFLSLVLERCVLVDGASEDLRVAGLRAANVFMARSAKANERDGVAAGGESMDSKGDRSRDDDELVTFAHFLVFPHDALSLPAPCRNL